MKNLLASILVLGISILASAQNHRKCASHTKTKALEARQNSFAKSRRTIKADAINFSKASANFKKAESVYTIPVVVHVLYKTATDNISDAQIQSQLTVLNKDFRKMNSDVSKAPAEFAPLAADVKLEFVLATKDPNGKVTTGIIRKSTTKTTWADDDMKFSSKGGSNAWNTKKYLNIWVCNLSDGTLGFAYLPGSGIEDIDGLAINPKNFGSKDYDANGLFNLESGLDLGRTATHEIGHYLNLEHIWGDGACSATDYVSDTPSAEEEYYGCPSYPSASCGSNDMTMNYMDYVDDKCMYMFTTGQKNRMRALFASGGFRYELINQNITTLTDPEPEEPLATSTESDLIISGYVEGTSYNKAIQIKNVSNNTVNLSDYSLKLDINGGGTWSREMVLEGTLAAGKDYLYVYYRTTESVLLDRKDELVNSSTLNFNGNDPVGLFKSNVLVDVVGKFSGGDANFAQDEILVRRADVNEPTTNFLTSQWIYQAVNDFGGIGIDAGTAADNTVIISGYVEGTSYNKAIEITNIGSETISLSDYSLKLNVNGGSDWSRTIDLTGILAPGQDFLYVYYRASDNELLSFQDELVSSSVLNFNGNDPVGLFKSDQLVDVVGNFASGETYFAKDVVLIRKQDVSESSTSYLISQWISQAATDFYGIGPDVPIDNEYATDLFISEYVEGSSYNKAIEIANFTGEEVDLSNYQIKKNSNGGTSWSTAPLSLSGTLNHGDTYTIVYNRTLSTTLQNKATIETNSSNLNFNGNDPIGFFKEGVLLDIVGNFNGGSSYFAQDVTLVRNSNVASPTSSYNSNQWTEYTTNTFSNLGAHTLGSQSTKTTIAEDETTEIELTVYPNPTTENVTIALDVEHETALQLTIYNDRGAIVYKEDLGSQVGSLSYTDFNVAGFTAGTYFVTITSNTFSKVARLVVL